MSKEEVVEMLEDKQAKANAQILEMVSDGQSHATCVLQACVKCSSVVFTAPSLYILCIFMLKQHSLIMVLKGTTHCMWTNQIRLIRNYQGLYHLE